MPLSKDKKVKFLARLQVIFASYQKFFVVLVDNVGSKSIQKTRLEMRGTSEILMGKNTLIRKGLEMFLIDNPDHPMAAIGEFLVGNTGFVFTNNDLAHVRKLIVQNRVPAPARIGGLAPIDVIVPAGATGCDPGQTSFFQVLQIPTKIVKGQIEITSQVDLIKKGEKVGSSEAALLTKLSIRPFEYGFEIIKIYDSGSMFGIEVLDIDDNVLTARFGAAVRDVAALSLALRYPTAASLYHSVAGAFKDMCSIVVELENYSFPKAEPFKAFVKDPSAFAGCGGGGGEAAAPVAAAPAAGPVEEEVDPMEGGMDMFGGGGADY